MRNILFLGAASRLLRYFLNIHENVIKFNDFHLICVILYHILISVTEIKNYNDQRTHRQLRYSQLYTYKVEVDNTLRGWSIIKHSESTLVRGVFSDMVLL